MTPEPKDYFWVILSDKQHEVPGRIPKEVVEQCLKCGLTYTVSRCGFSDRLECREPHRGDKFTRHTGSLIDIRNFTPLFIRVEDGPSTSTTREVLALEIKRAKLRGATREPTWGSPQPLDSVPELKEWLHELRKPDGNQCVYPALHLASLANNSPPETYSGLGRSNKMTQGPLSSSLNPLNSHLAFTSDRQRTPPPLL